MHCVSFAFDAAYSQRFTNCNYKIIVNYAISSEILNYNVIFILIFYESKFDKLDALVKKKFTITYSKLINMNSE